MTILEELKKSNDFELTQDLNNLVVDKLVSLFNHVFSFDISNTPVDNFVFEKNFLENQFKYTFEYGQVRVTTYSDKLNVCFYFNSTMIPMVPPGLTFGAIKVDDMLNYKQAIFQACFNFGSTIPYYPEITRSSFHVEKIFNAHLEIETRLIYILRGANSGGVDFNLINFPKIFFENNNDFDTHLMKMLDYCSKNSNLFYDIFEEYPSHEEIIKDPSEFNTFLSLFHTQYTKNKEYLNSKIILLDMQAI